MIDFLILLSLTICVFLSFAAFLCGASAAAVAGQLRRDFELKKIEEQKNPPIRISEAELRAIVRIMVEQEEKRRQELNIT